MIPADNPTRYFFELTPQRILGAVERLGLRCTGRCLALNSMENRVYEVEVEVKDQALPRGAVERFRVVKFYRPGRWSLEQILEEHEYLLDLAQAGVPVARPVASSDGTTLHVQPEAEIFFSVFEKAAGRSPSDFSDRDFEVLGRTLGMVHSVGAGKSARHRLKLTAQAYGLDNLRFLVDSKTLPPEIVPLYTRPVEGICQVAQNWLSQIPGQRIHGDLHRGNLLWHKDGPVLMDFDDMLSGPAVQDLWLIAPGRDEEARRLIEVMLHGYEQKFHFDRSTLGLIETLRGLRMVHFSAWIARRWHDPAFPRTFPHFGSMQYWKEQVADLQEQYELICSG